jgi:hypothetical protein
LNFHFIWQCVVVFVLVFVVSVLTAVSAYVATRASADVAGKVWGL